MHSSEEGPRAESAHEPNVIRNSDSDDDADAFTEPAGVHPHAIPRQAPHAEPAGGLHRVAGADIKNIMNSKKDMYTILATHGQLHLPCYDDVSMEFLREVMAERKRLIPLRNVVHVNVPKFEEFQTERLYRQALADPNMRLFLPEPHQNDKRSVSRKFLFNVSAMAPLTPDAVGDRDAAPRLLPGRDQQGLQAAQGEEDAAGEPLHRVRPQHAQPGAELQPRGHGR